MDRKKNLMLALCLLTAGTVSAADDSVTEQADNTTVSNIPPELSPPETAAPYPSASASETPALPALPEPPAPSAESCGSGDVADCRASSSSTDAPKRRTGSSGSQGVRIGRPAQRAIAESHAWAENPDAMPVRDAAGRVVFAFSESAPTIVCATTRVCDVELQPGEVVRGAPHIGDAVRWKVAPAVSGSGDDAITHLVVKPTQAGLDTNLIVTTDRRTYHLRLVSSSVNYVSSVAFDYPDDTQQAWKDLAKSNAVRSSNNDAGGLMPTVAVNRLNFRYKIKVVKGKPTFKPVRAMDDGYHTYITMNEDLLQREAPALIGISPNGEEQMINYRLKGNLYVVDGTIYKLALVSGVGSKQQRVELSRDTCQRRGWLGICWDSEE